jgi:hypothetical protein
MTTRSCQRCGYATAHYSVQERAWLCGNCYFAGADTAVTGGLPPQLELPTLDEARRILATPTRRPRHAIRR